MLSVGYKGPDFNLKDNRNRVVRLSDLAGKKVLLSFHPLAWTKVCAEQMKLLEKDYELYQNYNCVPLGISVDAVPSKNAWAKTLEVRNTQLLSDFWPHGALAKAYGVFRETDGFSERANLLLGEDHRIIFARVYPIEQLPDMGEILGLLMQYDTSGDTMTTIKDVNPSG